MKTSVVEPTPKKYLFEEQFCTRCGGGGKYSYCHSYGDRCFKCGGSGRTLTKRGQAAQAFYTKSCKIEAAKLKVGDLIQVQGITLGGQTFKYKAEVTEFSIDAEAQPSGMKSLIDGVWIEAPPYRRVRFTTKSLKFGELGETCPETSTYKIYRADDNLRKEAALEYQKTLNKNGTESKKLKKAGA